jgi:molybdate transport system permease protein
MPLSKNDLDAILLTLELASLTTVLLLIIGTPIALWLSRTDSWLKRPVGAVVALPLVLPPTVIGFYLLVSMGPKGFFGQLTQSLGLGTFTFSFTGLVMGSIFYSLPFVVQPLQNAFETIGLQRAPAGARWRPRRPCAPAPGTAFSAWCCRWRARASSPHRSWPSLTPLASSAWC